MEMQKAGKPMVLVLSSGREMQKAGKPMVLVLSSGRPLALQRVEPLCDAIVEMWQPGVPGGRPVAGVLSGRVNPSGKLSVTFPRTTGQIPVYYNRRQSSRPRQGLYTVSGHPVHAPV